MVWEWIVGGSAAVVGLASYFAYRSFEATAEALEVPIKAQAQFHYVHFFLVLFYRGCPFSNLMQG